jgi:plastocyanin
MRARRAWLCVVLFALTAPSASAGPLDHELYTACVEAGAPEAGCATMRSVADGLERGGVSAGDFTGDGAVAIEVADFYFSPHLSVMRNGQTVVFTNTNRAGGNRHSVSSADLGGDEPVLPVPLGSFGGGRAFRSGRLEPGDPFVLTIDVATMDPRAYVPLPNGDYLIGFFCYIHGASQMNGQLLVTNDG